MDGMGSFLQNFASLVFGSASALGLPLSASASASASLVGGAERELHSVLRALTARLVHPDAGFVSLADLANVFMDPDGARGQPSIRAHWARQTR